MICWVDDNDDLRRAVAEHLRASGHQVIDAGSAEEALATLEREDVALQLLLTDFRLPGRNGLELAASLHARPETSEVPVLLVTSHAGAEDLDGWLGEPGFAVLQKPFEIEDLDRAVSTFLAGDTPRTGFRPPVSTDGSVIAETPPVTSPADSRPPWLRPVLAAVLSLAVLVGAWPWLVPQGGSAPELPDAPNANDVRRSGVIQTLGPFGPVATVPRSFRWDVVSQAARYRVQVEDVAGKTLWQGETEKIDLALPPELADRLLPLAAYYWRVEAYDASDRLTASSDPVRFRIVEPEAGPDSEPEKERSSP